MPEREAQDSPSAPPNTPRVSGEVPAGLGAAESTPLPQSSTRAANNPDEAPAVSEPGDTLLSAGKPADRLEVMLEDRLALVDERMRELDQRLSTLEQKKPTKTEEPRAKPWLWIAFLIALVVVFQMLQAVR